MAAIGLAMPASWSRVDLDPRTSDESNRRLVDEAIPAGPGAERARALMLELLQQAAGRSEQQVVLSAIYSAVADGTPLGASLVASVLHATPGPDGAPPPDGPSMAESLRTTVGNGGGERVDLPAGPAVRVRRRQRTAAGGADVEVESVQWFVLHPAGSSLAVLSFSTPNVGLAEPFGEVFDAIAWSMQWTD